MKSQTNKKKETLYKNGRLFVPKYKRENETRKPWLIV